MTRRWLGLGGALVILTAFAAGITMAGETGLASELERSGTIDPQSQMAYGEASVKEIQGIVDSLKQLLTQVEQGTEEYKCVLRALTISQTLQSSAGGAKAALARAAAENNAARAQFHVRVIAVALTKSREAYAKGQFCVSGNAVASGETDINVRGGLEGDEEDDFAPIPLNTAEIGFDPPDVSPYL